jgi:signal transduction histidine kinase
LALAAVIINAIVYVFFSWRLVPATHLQLWLGVVFAIVAARVYWQAQWLGLRPRTTADIAVANRWLTVLACLSAASWGFGMSLLLNTGSTEHFMLTVCIIAGLGAGAAGAYSSSLRISQSFIALLILPLALRLLVIGREPFTTVGWLTIVYAVLLSLVIFNSNRQVRRSIEICLENEDLVHRLGEASHEIRTPVSAISGFAEILAGMEETASPAKQYASAIGRNCAYLKRLLDNVLIISRAESETNCAGLEIINLRSLVAQTVEMVRPAAERKGLYIKLQVAPNVPESARLQPIKVQQILANLLTNAVKFTPQGGIDVSVRLSRGVELVFQVCDTGIGISGVNREAVFRAFWRENRADKNGDEGAGLGLALARTLATSMGGELNLITSECNCGSTFELRIPLVV